MPPAEYLAFVGSVGWLVAAMMAAILPSLPGGFGRRHAGWLFAFCLTRLFVEVAALAIFGAESPGETWRAVAAITSGMVLWEFARRLWNDCARRRIATATHVIAVECVALLLAMALPLGDAPRPTWFAPIALFATLLPGVLGFGSALVLWRCLGDDVSPSRRTALRVAVLGLGAYGLFSAMPGLSAGEVLPPWIVVAGLGFAAMALPAARTRFTVACATALLAAIVVGPYATGLYVSGVTEAQFTQLRRRAESTAAPWQGRFTAALPTAPAEAVQALVSETVRVRATDPLLRDLRPWNPGVNEPRARPILARTHARSLLEPPDGSGLVVVHVPLRAAPFESAKVWLAFDYPDAPGMAERRHARRSGLALAGAFAAFCAVGFVLTVRHALENAQLLALERAESADRAKTEFLAFLSHEMRTPLQTILGRAELLPRETPAATRHAEAIAAQGAHLLRLVNDLLDLGTIEAGKLKLQPAPFRLRALLASLEEIHGPTAAAKSLALDLTAAPGVPDTLLGDEARLRQILGNLLGNAVKYTARGHVALHVSAVATVSGSQLSALSSQLPAPRSPLLQFTVTDTGPGLPPDKISQLFTLFKRLDAGDTFTREGTGVGLALVRRLCDLMGGTAAAANRPEGGAIFTVQLAFPVAETVSVPAPAASAPAAPALSVLVAEDNAEAREFLAEALASLGHRVETVGDGDAVLAACAARNFDAVLLDINLPGRDGIALARILTSSTPRPRLVACSAEVFAATREAALAAGMDAFLEKPATLAALAAALTPAAAAPVSAQANLFERLRSPELSARARTSLLHELPAAIATLNAAHAAGDAPAVQRHAHRLRATALLAGDEPLAELCRRLEYAAAAGERAEIHAIIAEFSADETRGQAARE